MSDYGDVSLLEGIEYFFNAIKQKCFSKEEYAAELLKARGFLLEDNELALSDNSFFAKNRWTREIIDSPMNDANYLNELLKDQNVGEVQGNKIIIFPNANVEKIFYSSIQWGSESFLPYGGVNFFRYEHAPKVPVGLLEKFIARYVKAISACGVQTHGSCDGNHHRPPGRGIFIEISTGMGKLWHKILCERLLYKRFNFRWLEHCKIRINRINKWKTYVELNRAAEFLYKHRIEIRQIKCKVCEEIQSGLRKDKTLDVIKFFSERTNELFDKILIE